MITRFYFTVLITVVSTGLFAQQRELVWAEEFNNNTLDPSLWAYETGISNDNLHYYTTRPENVTIVDSVLNIIALEESYNGLDYTSGLIKTKMAWRYGRMEARIKLPAGKGFVPAFWMLPIDNMYGWWPNSGEIDIMEHPTNELSNIYGSIHTKTYNNFSGIGNEGDVTSIPDAETVFHIYAVEWDANKIDFYVDDNLYYTFTNDQKGSASWPFDQPFYIILNLAVGGGWVGAPDETTVFPAIMEVDWVRVYQYPKDIQISGPEFVTYNSENVLYSVPDINGATYDWQVPGNATINNGQNSHQLELDWTIFGGSLKANITTQNNFTFSHPVHVSANLLKNGDFERGVKFWNSLVGFPAQADFRLNDEDYVNGDHSLMVDVKNLGSNPWDVQLSQQYLTLNSGQEYTLGFWAKSDNANAEINLTYINDVFFAYHTETFQLSGSWTYYEYSYTSTNNDQVSLNIDMGKQTGVYYFDDFFLTTPELSAMNQIYNGDFFNGPEQWNLTTLGSAEANGSVADGEYVVSVNNGGLEVWDVHLGQSPVNIQNGKEYNVTFDAYASASRTINVLVGKNSDPWTVYHETQSFALTTEKQTFSYSFVMNHPTDVQARFGFDIGDNSGYIFFDNIWLSSGTTPASALSSSKIHPDEIALMQNYPNPFNPQSTINYYLPVAGYVKLSLFNTLGQSVKELDSGNKPAGYHTIDIHAGSLTSGIYFYRLQVDNNYTGLKKLVILK